MIKHILLAILLISAVCLTVIGYHMNELIVYEASSEVSGWERDGEYVLCYREQFESGLGVERFTVVSEDEYLREVSTGHL